MNIATLTQHDATRQALRLRRTFMALIGAVFHTLLCLLIWDMGFFRTSFLGFILLFLGLWIVHLSFPLLIVLGWNRKFSDPSMTWAEVFWGVTAVLITVYFTDEMRPAVMMFILLTLAFGAFQLTQKQFTALIFYALFGYVVILYLLSEFRPLEVVYREEIIAIASFIIVCFTFSMVSHEMASIRRHLQKKTIQLRDTLADVENASVTDDLTGIKNRRFIFGVLEQQRWMAERQPHYSFALIMLDIDYFKKINDEYGHAVGDTILKETCLIVERELRKMDFFARLGGEEFLIVIPFSDLDKANIMAKRIREKIEITDFSKVTPLKQVTLSLGVTLYQSPEDIEQTLKRADKAMYLAKQQGRNQIVSM